MKKQSIIYSMLIVLCLIFACKKSKDNAVSPTCYSKSDIVGKHLTAYMVNTTPTNVGYFFEADSVTQTNASAGKYKVDYRANYDSLYIHYSSTAVSGYAVSVNNCTEFTIKSGAYTTYLK